MSDTFMCDGSTPDTNIGEEYDVCAWFEEGDDDSDDGSLPDDAFCSEPLAENEIFILNVGDYDGSYIGSDGYAVGDSLLCDVVTPEDQATSPPTRRIRKRIRLPHPTIPPFRHYSPPRRRYKMRFHIPSYTPPTGPGAPPPGP